MSCPVLNSGELKLKHLIGSSRVSGAHFGELEGSPRFPATKMELSKQSLLHFSQIFRNYEKYTFFCNSRERFPEGSPVPGSKCNKLCFVNSTFRNFHFQKMNVLLLIGTSLEKINLYFKLSISRSMFIFRKWKFPNVELIKQSLLHLLPGTGEPPGNLSLLL